MDELTHRFGGWSSLRINALVRQRAACRPAISNKAAIGRVEHRHARQQPVARGFRCPADPQPRVAERCPSPQRACDNGIGRTVPAERFSMWVIEDKFAAGRPAWEAVLVPLAPLLSTPIYWRSAQGKYTWKGREYSR